MDLLGRKLGMNKGKTIMDLLGEIQKTIAAARTNSRTEEFANKVEAAVNKLGEVALHLGKTAMSPDVMAAFANAYAAVAEKRILDNLIARHRICQE